MELEQVGVAAHFDILQRDAKYIYVQGEKEVEWT
jgi:hypothetical protein